MSRFTTLKKVQINMSYNLTKQNKTNKVSSFQAFKKLWPIIVEEKKIMTSALVAVILSSAFGLVTPRLIAYTIDTQIINPNYRGVLIFSGIILGIYLLSAIASYIQIRLMGGVGQRVLYRLRKQVFNKLQELPVEFFNENKAGDLISRINNDTDKINQFFSQALVQFIANIFMILGAAIFLVSLNVRLGLATLIPAVLLLLITRVLSSWVKKRNFITSESLGSLSSEIQESLNNFKVIIAFNRRDFFKERFQKVNEANYSAAVHSGIANNTFIPIYGLASNLGQLIVLVYGIFLISKGEFTIGLLIGFIAYATSFYNPLRQLAALWANFQTALASLDRIHEILVLENKMVVLPKEGLENKETVLEFKNVGFKYFEGRQVLNNVSFKFEKGKTYALVGPTGGGKTTTASLMARLYDPTEGEVLLDGRNIKSFSPEERTNKIGFILQEPILFTGTVGENILYGNDAYSSYDNKALEKVIIDFGLESLLKRFGEGLETKVATSGDAISLGQKQLIAFIRAVLRSPEILILDEATANIDTMTEKLLDEVLLNLPKDTTKIIIAHRLNTIDNADEILFVNGGKIIVAGSMDHAVEMLMSGKNKT